LQLLPNKINPDAKLTCRNAVRSVADSACWTFNEEATKAILEKEKIPFERLRMAFRVRATTTSASLIKIKAIAQKDTPTPGKTEISCAIDGTAKVACEFSRDEILASEYIQCDKPGSRYKRPKISDAERTAMITKLVKTRRADNRDACMSVAVACEQKVGTHGLLDSVHAMYNQGELVTDPALKKTALRTSVAE
jgi:hypothetical protein